MKRILCVLLILIMLIPPMAVSAEAQPAIAISNAQGRKGDQVKVVVSATNLPDCASMDLILQYDTSVLKPTALAKGDLTGIYAGNEAYTIRESDGIGKVGEPAIKIGAGTTSATIPLLSGNPTLVTITFELLANPDPAGAKVELVSYRLSKMDADLTKITGIALPTGYVTPKPAETCAVTAPTKTTYYTGDPLNLEGGSIWVSYADDDQETVALFDLPEGAISGYDPQEVGPQTIYVTYAGVTGSFEIEVLQLAPTDLEVTKQPTKTSYIVGQQFDLAGGELTLAYNNGSEEIIPLTNDLIDPNIEYELREGWCMIPVIYKGRTATVNIYFEARAVVDLSVINPPQKTTYVEGQPLDLSGGVLLATFNDESTEEIAMTNPLVGVEGYDPTAIGEQQVTLNYSGQETEIHVTVIEKAVESIAIKTNPTKIEYIKGQPFDLAGGKLTATYNDGERKDVPFSDSGVSASGYDPTTIGEQTITVTYEGKTADYTIHVIPKVEERIELISAPDKKSYIQGENLDITGGKIRVVYNDGDTKEETITMAMVSGYQPNTVGNQNVTVTYKGKTAQFTVRVISLAQAPAIRFSSAEGIIGQTVTVTLSSLRAPLSGGFQLELSYDSSKLKPISWTDGMGGNLVPNNDALNVQAGKLKLGGIYMGTFGGNETLGSITFRVLSAGETYLTIDEGGFIEENLSLVTAQGIYNPIRLYQKNAFKDVLTTDYFYQPVLWALTNGITTGTAPDQFSSADGCTRAQVVTFLWRSAGKPEPTSSRNPFVDVKSGEYYYKAVLWAVEKGITNGMDATHFGTDITCTRGQIVTFLWRAKGKPAPASSRNPFTDVKSGEYYYNAVLWAVENGITNGMDATHFAPESTCIRGQIVTFLYRNEKPKEK